MNVRFFCVNVQLQSYERALFRYERAMNVQLQAYERAYERAITSL